MDKIFYGAALANLCMALSGCYPSELIKESPSAGADIVTGIPTVLANPGAIGGWVQIIGGAAVLFAAGFAGPKAVKKVKAFFGK